MTFLAGIVAWQQSAKVEPIIMEKHIIALRRAWNQQVSNGMVRASIQTSDAPTLTEKEQPNDNG